MPNLPEAQRFLDLLGPGEKFTFQTFADKKQDAHRAATEGCKPQSLIRVLHGTLSQRANELIHLNQCGAGVFVMVNEGDGIVHEGKNTCRDTASVIRVRALFVDLDGAPLEPVLKHSIHPSIVVESSPDRWHAYWLSDGCTLEDFKSTQQRLAHQFGGDKKVCDLPRVMRLPGFLHQKSEPFMTKIIYPEA